MSLASGQNDIGLMCVSFLLCVLYVLDNIPKKSQKDLGNEGITVNCELEPLTSQQHVMGYISGDGQHP